MKHIIAIAALSLIQIYPLATQCMDRQGKMLYAQDLIDNGQPNSSSENCTQEECKAGSTAFTLSATLGSIIAFPVCSALGAPFGIAALATLGSGLTGTMLYMCCYCRNTSNSQENI